MAPKTNKQREKLEQNQASSRAKAQETLRGVGGFVGFASFAKSGPGSTSSRASSSAATSAAAANPFASFASTGGGYGGDEYGAIAATSTSSSSSSAMYDGADHEIAMALKMLGKKGTVTKMKALHSFLTEILPHKKPLDIRAMVGHFVQLYTFEIRDQKDRKVRHLLNEVLLALMTKLKPKAFAPHLRRLVPYWLMAMHDPNSETAAAASNALEALFPANAEMQAAIIVAHLSATMEEYSTFFQHTPETFPGVVLSASDEREERFERCVAAAVLSIDKIVTLFATTGNLGKLHEQDTPFTVAGVVSGDKFGKLVAATSKNNNFSRDAIRQASYKTLKSLVDVAFVDVVQPREEYFGKLILGALSDKHPMNQQAMWDMVLTFLQAATAASSRAPKSSLWTSASFPKFVKSAVFPRLFAQVRHGFYGSAKTSFPVLLPLLSMVPLEHVVDTKTGTCALYSGVVENAFKFLASSESRFYEDVVIASAFECLRAFGDYFLRSPTNREAASEIFGDHNCNHQEMVAAYVGQFEKAMKDALLTVFTLSRLTVCHVTAFATEWQSMAAKLRAASDPVSSPVATHFVEASSKWLSTVLESLPSNDSVEAHRVHVLLKIVVESTIAVSEEAKPSLFATCTRVYQSCLTQLTHPSAASRALEIMLGLHEVVGARALGLLDTAASVEQHYETHIRPLVAAAGVTLAEGSNGSAAGVKIVLRVAKQFYSLVSDKKAFVLQLFQDFAVQYGDMEKAALVVETCFRYPFESSGAEQWLTSGSFHHMATTTTTADDHALSPVWKGRLLDEFVMISLKGRLDDLDADAFSSLLSSCLGGEESSMPVVSPDVVVILSHFAHQQQQTGQSHVAMRILPSLVRLFGRLSDDALPSELRSAHEQLFMCLFHLAAKSNFKTEAETLWNHNVRAAIANWSSGRRLAFIHSLADTINEVFASESKTSYSPKIWASYVELFLALASGREDQEDASPFALINRLTIFDLRFDGTRAQLTKLYDRLLSCLAELCDDDESGDATRRVAGFFEELIAREEARGLKLLRRVLDIDVCHGLTYAILQSESMAALSRDSAIAPLESVSLRPLYTSLAPYLPRVLAAISGDQQADAETETPRYRKVLFMNQQTESGVVDDVDALEDLTSEQHLRLDRLVAAVLFSLLPLSETMQHATTWLGQPRPIASSVAPIDRVVHILQAFEDAEAADVGSSVVARSAELLTQWPSPGGVQALKVFTNVWTDRAHGFDASTHHPLLLKMSRSFAMASQTTLTEWLDAAAYLTAMPLAWTHATTEEATDTLEDTTKRWSLAARGLVTHALAGKQGMAAVAALRIHKRTLPATLDAEGDEEELTTVVEFSTDLVRCRRGAAQLAQTMASVDNGEPLLELATDHREALLSTLLVGLAESLAIKAKLVPTYLGLHSPTKSLAVIELSAEIDALLDATAIALPVMLRVMMAATATSSSESDRVKSLLLDAFVSLKGLAACFNSDKSHTPPHVRTLLYTICSATGVFKPSGSAATNAGIDINADDEAATEAALAKSIIPAGLRAALKAAYPSPSSATATAANASSAKRSRRQHRRTPVEDEEDDIVGRLLVWDLFVQLFPDSGSRDGGHLGMRSSALSAYVAKNGLLSSYLSLCGELLSRETGAQSLVARLTLRDDALYTLGELPSLQSGADWVVSLAARSFFRTVLRLPAMVRTWWNDECSRSLRSWASKYFEEHITPYVLTSELEIIQKASETRSWDVEEMSVKGSKVSREITTTYVKDECALEMVIRVPSSYPLRSVEVECTRRIGITEDRWRRWVLQIIKVTSAQDGSLLDAVLLWKQNVDKEFEGVEPCPICYSILNPKTMGLPSLSCKTCANKYHNSCLYKWFNQSGKNKCPICQQPFT